MLLLLHHDHMRQVQLHLSEHRGVSNNNVVYHILESNTHTHTSIGTANFKQSVVLILSNNDSGTSRKCQLELKDSEKTIRWILSDAQTNHR